MTTDLPGPDEIIEELADKVRSHIDRDAPVAFDNALGELTGYHRFLLSIGSTHTSDGVLMNWAEISSAYPSTPNSTWNRQYIRLFERATARITENDHYLRSISYVPTHLLPRPGDPELSKATLMAISDLYPSFVHRLASWFTMRANRMGEREPTSPLALFGSDDKAYREILPQFVGATESWLQHVPRIFGWEEKSSVGSEEIWNRYCESWPVLWKHLHNTAYSLAIAVWNDDNIGSDYFRDALVKWQHVLGYRLSRPADLRWRRLLMPDIMKLRWPEAKAKAQQYGYEHDPEPEPTHVFTSVVRQAHDDVLKLTAATLLYWAVANKRRTKLAIDTADSVLQQKVLDEDSLRPVHRPLSFRHLLLDVLRFEIAGHRFQENVYGADLDNLVSRLDQITERAVVTGRVYTPSTIHGREELRPAIIIMLAVYLASDKDEMLNQAIDELATNTSLLPEGDGSLTSVLNELRAYRAILESPPEGIAAAISRLAPDKDVSLALGKLDRTLNNLASRIAGIRDERLRLAPVDEEKVAALRNEVERKLLSSEEVPFFSNFKIHTSPSRDPSDRYTSAITNVSKGAFVTPPIGQVSVNLNDRISSRVASHAADRVWDLFCDRSRINVKIAESVDAPAFWKEVSNYIASVGPHPTLLVSMNPETRALRRLAHGSVKTASNLRVQKRPGVRSSGQYLATIEDVDVFGTNMDAGKAWLFSAELLQEVMYSETDVAHHFVEASFEAQADGEGTLRFKFYQRVDWRDLPCFEITLGSERENETGH